MKSLRKFWKNLQTISKDIWGWVNEYPGCTFLIISTILIIGVIHISENTPPKEVVYEEPVVEIDIYNPEESSEPVEISLSNKDVYTNRISPILVTFFLDKPYHLNRTILRDNDMQFTIKYDNIEELYTKRNETIEAEIIELYKEIKALFMSFNLQYTTIEINVEGYSNDELVYFTVAKDGVNWTRYDEQIKWREGDDLTEWFQEVEYLDEQDLSNDEDFQDYVDLITEIKKQQESGALEVYGEENDINE